ncbi:hypothetical protein [Rhodopirellula baltica]|uniref:Uncharacterized protein n=6 Tax=Rhodopirellula TaxID=265488 RepID=Q7UX14_RHOBA|nr:hypothetical protein RE6C_00243 [Rhodopirellula europaea 6C]EMI27453.1 hypothetical protein RESH_01855 [Rhodopirellula europaea SH398]CAD72198.1 hypothetical protein RB1632 [Rhodopirellula baltica SH 1]HBE66246.1 hypothetical protein [Rhodopirellula baltica]
MNDPLRIGSSADLPSRKPRKVARMTSKMTSTLTRFGTLCLLTTVVISSTGCYGLGGSNYNLGILGFPIPVSPYYQHKQEEKFHNKERYDRVPILGPTTSGGPPIALDPPSDDEVMQALEQARPVQGGIPLIWEKQRNDVRIIKEKIADYIDPPRFYPLIGPAQLHHAHYKCTIYFDESTIIGYPVPHTLRDREAIEVVYIDHNHFHMVGDVEPYTTPNL